MSLYPRIPNPSIAAPDDSRESYGLQLLAYVIRERTACTFSADQISLALHVAPIAAAVRVQISSTSTSTGSDRTRTVDLQISTAETIAEAKRELLAEARRLQAYEAGLADRGQGPSDASSGARNNAGSGGSRVPRRPIVGPLAPTGAAASLSQPARAIDWDQVF
jgi:hypothetical protein